MSRSELRWSWLAIVAIMSVLVVRSDAREQSGMSTPDAASPLRYTALSLLNSAIDELQNIEDVELRISFAEDIIKLLVKDRPERCRHLLDTLYDDVMRLKADGASTSDTRHMNVEALTRRIIQIATIINHDLARSYIDRYAEQVDTWNKEQRGGFEKVTPPAELYIVLAIQLVEHDPALAVSVAELSIKTGITPRTLEFLGLLRTKDIRLASIFFTSALQSISARRGTDLNETLLLFAYAFSPTRVPLLTSQGLAMQHIPGYARVARDYPIDPTIARQYLQATAQLLLDPIRYQGEGAALIATARGDLYLINLIKPLVGTYLPNLLASLQERQDILVGYLQPNQYHQLQSEVGQINVASERRDTGTKPVAPTIESLLDRASAITDPAKRDQMYYTIASSAVRQGDYDSALNIANKISEDFRAGARDFIVFSIAQRLVTENQLERAEQMARRDSDIIRRAYIFILIANALVESKGKDLIRADELLVEAGQLASKADGEREKISTLLKEAEAYSLFDSVRAAEVLRIALKAADKKDWRTGSSTISRHLRIGSFSFFYELYDDKRSITYAINQLARKDFNGLLFMIRGIQNPVLRLRSMIALCGGAL